MAEDAGHWELEGVALTDWVAVVDAMASGKAVRWVGPPEPEKTPARRLDDAVVDLLHLTECRCGLEWLRPRRHAPECVSEYREDVLVLMEYLSWPEH